jgi:hypothetical protein
VIQEKVFIAEKNVCHTPKFHLVATSVCPTLEIGSESGIVANFLSYSAGFEAWLVRYDDG